MYNFDNTFLLRKSEDDMMNDYTQWVYLKLLKAKMLQQNNMLQDYGPEPFVFDIEEILEENNNFRVTLWTGNHLQLALMSINARDEIGAEIHPDVDQFVYIEDGEGVVMIGDTEDNLNYQANVSDGIAIIIPAGKWHNIRNIGNTPLKLYTIYAPPEHPFGTIQRNKSDAN